MHNCWCLTVVFKIIYLNDIEQFYNGHSIHLMLIITIIGSHKLKLYEYAIKTFYNW